MATAMQLDPTDGIDIDEEIDQWLATDVVGPAPLPEPTDDIDLSRILDRARAAQQEVDRLKELAKARIADIEAWLARTAGVPERRRDWLYSLAKDVALRRLLAHDGTVRQVTIKLPEGRIVAKHQEPEYKVDHETLGNQLAGLGLVEYVQPIGKWGAVKPLTSLDSETGRVLLGGVELDGVTATPRPPKAEVKPA